MTVEYKGEKKWLAKARNDLGIRTYQRVFLMTAGKTDSIYAIGSHASLPKIGSYHPDDASAWCRSLDIECINDPGYVGWHVTAQYSSEFEMAENPLLEPARIRVIPEPYREVVWQDRDGLATLNSAGDYLSDPAPEKEKHRRIFVITKNVADVPSWLIDTEEDPINSSAFYIKGKLIATGKAKLGRVELGEIESRNGVQFMVLTMEIAVSAAGWALKPLDAGFRAYDSVTGTMIRIHNGDGTDPPQPVPLDGAGEPLTAPSPATAVYRTFNVYPQLDFNLLPLT